MYRNCRPGRVATVTDPSPYIGRQGRFYLRVYPGQTDPEKGRRVGPGSARVVRVG